MNRLEKLIHDLCADGVEFVPLNAILDYEQPTKYIVKSTNYSDEYITPVLTAGQSLVLGYIDEIEGIYNASTESPVIIFDDFTTSFHWIGFKFKVKSSAMKMIKPKADMDEEINFRYVYHCMKNISYEPVDHSRQWISKYSIKKIPLPPRRVQDEIVRILDNFTELTAELKAELVARREQFEYYRDDLLTFGDVVDNVKLKDFATLIRGSGLPKSDFSDNGIGCIHYGQIYTHYGTFTNITKSFISVEKAEKLKTVSAGDLIITNTSENEEDVCTAVVWLGDNDIVTGGHATIVKHNQNPKFLAYYTQTSEFFKEKRKHTFGVKVYDVSPTNMGKIKFPIPSLEEQQRIVDILERFDILCNDVITGLPAEIKAREEQYEYYRDKLLTFKEVSYE